jgi:hypothetical protein
VVITATVSGIELRMGSIIDLNCFSYGQDVITDQWVSDVVRVEVQIVSKAEVFKLVRGLRLSNTG